MKKEEIVLQSIVHYEQLISKNVVLPVYFKKLMRESLCLKRYDFTLRILRSTINASRNKKDVAMLQRRLAKIEMLYQVQALTNCLEPMYNETAFQATVDSIPVHPLHQTLT